MSKEEVDAMKQYLKEKNAPEQNGETAVRKAIEEMKGSDHTIGKRLHSIIMKSAPTLVPRTWYGMPAYADKEGKVVCFFQPAQKFKTRYMTLGFSDKANLDDGSMWSVGYALKELTPVEEAKISALVKKASS